MKWINYHHLIYFKVIAQQGSITKASEVLRVGQPALSSQLKNFEEQLGVELFERKNRKLILTEPGRIALEYAEKISSLGQELIEVIDDGTFSNQVNLSIGALDSIPKHLISDIVDFAHKKSGCFLSILEDSIESLLRKLVNHKIEVIISDKDYTQFEKGKVFSKKILKKQVSAYASPDFIKYKKSFPRSINQAPCILPTFHSKLRQDLTNYFDSFDIRPKIIAETQDTSLQKLLAARGDGIIFLPDFASKELVQNHSLIKIGKIYEVYCEYYLIYSKRIVENPALELILDQDFQKMRLG